MERENSRNVTSFKTGNDNDCLQGLQMCLPPSWATLGTEMQEWLSLHKSKMNWIRPLPNDKILHATKLKILVGDRLNFVRIMIVVYKGRSPAKLI